MTENDLSLEKALERIEAIAEEMESGSLSLEEMLSKFEEGSKLVKRCEDMLSAAEKRIEIVVKNSGRAEAVAPFEEQGEA